MRFSRILALVAALLLVHQVRGDEGMWLLPLLQKYNMSTMQKMGLQLSPEEIYDVNHASLKDAIVIFGNGCTGSVISNKGLVLTNHHCGYDAIQQHSTVEHDYLRDGFWAETMDQEIPTPGLSITFLSSIEDVTDRVNARLHDTMSESTRRLVISKAGDSIAAAAKGDTHYKTLVKSYYGDNHFYLLTYEVFTDIRMVLAPRSSIGKFGADTDNWMYPRHTGDVSLFRIYAGKDNKPAGYSKDNVPYKPRRFLSISIGGYKEGDFAMVMGNPGTTHRYMTSYEVQSTIDVTNKDRAHIRGVKQAIWQKHMDASQAVRIKYSSKFAQSANYWKNALGQSEALVRLNVIADKEREEEAFGNWVSQDKSRIARYGNALPMIRKGVAQYNGPHHVHMYYDEALMRGVEINRLAMRYFHLREGLEKKDTAVLGRMRRFTESKIKDSHFKDYDAATDKETAVAMLKLFREQMPREVWPSFYETIEKKYKGRVEDYVEKLFSTSIFASYDKLAAFMRNPSLKVLEGDMAYQMAESTNRALTANGTLRGAASDSIKRGSRLYIAGRLEMLNGAPSYPDANFTMRLTYGTVKGYSPRDAVSYNYYTTMDGLIEKDDPNSWEFAVDAKTKDLHRRRDYGRYALANGQLPVNFLTTNDITGGNSGSPVLDGRGRLIGCAFDGNWESLSGDIAFEHKLQRCINVDSRYILFLIEKHAGAYRLLDEMHIVSE